MPTDVSAILCKIAEISGSKESAEHRLEQVIGFARQALNLNSLSLVASGVLPGDSKSWHSSVEGVEFDGSIIEKAALDVLMDNDKKDVVKRDVLFHIISSDDGRRSVLVARGAGLSEINPVILQVTSSYLLVLAESCQLLNNLKLTDNLAKKQMQEVAAIYDIGQAIDPSGSDSVLNMIVKKAADVMDAQTCSLMLRDERDGCLVIEASYGLTDDIVKGSRINFGEGVAGKVLATGEPMLISDLSTDPRFEKVRPRSGVSGSICVPLKNEDGTMHGVLSIRRHVPKPPFTNDDLKLFCVFATHASLAISNANLYSRLHRKVQEMSTISGVMRAIGSTLELDEVLEQIIESITNVVGFDRCCVYLLDTRANELVAGARKGYSEGNRVKKRVRLGEGVIGLAAKEQIPIFSQGSPMEFDAVSSVGDFLAVPILVRDQCIGVVVVDNCLLNRRIDPEHVELLTTFVNQAGIAVENARLYEAMEEKYAELNVLYEHSKNISSAYGLLNVSEMLVQTASTAVKCDGAGLLLLDAKRGHLHLQSFTGGIENQAEEIEMLAQDQTFVNFVRELRFPMLLSPLSSERAKGPYAVFLNEFAPENSNILLAPLVTEDTTIGVLALYRDQSNEFQGSEFKLISIAATHASTILKNAISYEQKMRQRAFELTALYEFSKKISSASNLEEALDSILEIVADLVDYDESFIYVIDYEREIAAVRAARFRDESFADMEAINAEEPLDGSSVASWAISERKALVSPDISRDDRFMEAAHTNRPVKSLMSVPLIVQDEVVGVMNVHSYNPNKYSEDDVRVVSIIASQGAAIYKELEALSALTSYTDNILRSIAAGVVTLGSDGMILTWNTAAERIVGIKASRVVGIDYRNLLSFLRIADEDKIILENAITEVFQTGETYQGYKLCFHVRRSDEVFINMSISQLLNSAEEQLGLVVIFEDITREIKMETDVRRMSELAAVGQLAASIAHELRNPLSSIKGAAQFIQNEYEDQPSIVEFLGIIIEEVNGLNKLTTEFLDFARPLQLELKPCNLNRIIQKTLQLMSVHITDNNVAINENLHAHLPDIMADSKQLEQVFKNIVINSLQAMPEGGVLSIETGPALAGGAYMSVSDTGIGIPAENLERIFQPFITTKTKGTGLGLSIVNKIIENHGGKIEVTSDLGQGATFKVVLPKTGAPAVVQADIDHADHTMERRTSGKIKWDE